MKKHIPMVDLAAQYKYLRRKVFKRWKKLCSSTSFILGKEVAGFEEEFAEYCGRKYAVGVSSGTSALHLALEVLGCRGKNVITTPLTFIATCEAVVHAGGNIIWADVHPEYYTIDPDSIESLNPSESDIILPVHLYGQPAQMDRIMDIAKAHNLKVVEDCAQSHGALFNGKKAGTFGKLGCYSFYPGKNLGAYGDAGCIVCDDKDTAELVKRLRTHGSMDKYYHTEIGFNYRLDALQAAVLRVKLKYLDEWNMARREKADFYNESLSGLPVKTPLENTDARHVYHQYSIMAPERDKLARKLAEDGISTAVHYPIPIHLQPSFAHLGYGEGSFPVTEKIARECLSLPIYPELKLSDMEYISDRIREFYG
ncbi:MAG: DegT/DnrJ/EryC1/StrS family aminotransferase [Elusimicrobiota bacterium]